MAAPLPLSVINDHMPIASVEWDIQRNDELSSAGSGDVWQAELADPKWKAVVTLGRGLRDDLKQAAARLRSLDGSRKAFFLVDPLSLFPAADRNGVILGNSTVIVRATGNGSLAQLSGLPADYVLTVGDKMQVQYGPADDPRFAFVEVSETTSASVSGFIDCQVFPRLPLSLALGDAVTLVKPACAMIIQPTTHKPGVATRSIIEGAGFTALQKTRG